MRKRKDVPPSEAVQGKKLLTMEEAAWVLSLGRNSLYDLVLRGDIASVKIGSLRRVPVSALETFINHLLPQA